VGISNVFLCAAKSAGAIKKEKFSQGKLIRAEQSSIIRQGICGGISMIFLGLYAKHGLRSLTDAKSYSWSALLEFGLKIQNGLAEVHVDGVGQTASQASAQALAINCTRLGPVVGLKFVKMYPVLTWPCQERISRIVMSEPGYYLIGIPGHYVTAVCSRSGSTVFFDCNAGAAEFSGVDGMIRMLAGYFNNKQVMDLYTGSTNNVHIMRFDAM